MHSKGGNNETLDNLEQECGTYFQFFLRPPLLLDKKSVRPPLTNGQKKVDPPNSKKCLMINIMGLLTSFDGLA